MTDRTYIILAGLTWAFAAWLFVVAILSLGR